MQIDINSSLGAVSRYDSDTALATIRAAVIRGRVLSGMDPVRASRMDADTINLLRDFTARLGRVYEDVFPDLRAEEFIPRAEMTVTTTATSYLGEFLSRVGRAQIVTEVSTDLPAIQLKGTTFSGRIAMIGAAGVWTQEDLARGAQSLTNIPVKTQSGAREAIETAIDDLLTFGDPGAQIPGFARHPDVDAIPFLQGVWFTRDYQTILDDFHAWVTSINTRLAFVKRVLPDTVLLPESIRGVLARKRNSLGTDTALLAIIREAKETYGITVDFWYKLENASGSNGRRAIAYRKDSEFLGSVIPLDYLQFNPQERGLTVVTPAVAKCGGIVLIQAKTVVYGDNL